MKRLRERLRSGRWAGVLIMICVLLASATVWAEDEAMDSLDASDRPWAQGVSLEDQEAAKKLFYEGNDLLRDSVFAKAAEKYREALKHWDHPGIHYNLSLALMNLDQPIAVYESLGKAIEHGVYPLEQDKYDRAKSYRQLLEQQLARVEIVCDEPGAQVSLDGKHLFEGPGSHKGLMRTGEHSVVASKDGYFTKNKQLILSPGQQKRVEIKLVRVSDVAESRRRWAAWKPWAVVGGGAAVALAGGFLHWRARGDFDSFDTKFHERCQVNGCSEGEIPDLVDELDRAELEQKVAITSYLVGGTVLATGLVLVYLNQPRLIRKDTGDDDDISILPVLTPESTGVSASFRF